MFVLILFGFCCIYQHLYGALKTQEWKTREWKTWHDARQVLYVNVLEKVSASVSQFAPFCAVADFEEASVSAFSHVFQDAGVVGCWFHYAQAVMKRCNKIGLKESYGRDVDVATIVHCLHSAESAVASCLRYPWQQDAVSVGGKPFHGRTHGVIPPDGWGQQQQQQQRRGRGNRGADSCDWIGVGRCSSRRWLLWSAFGSTTRRLCFGAMRPCTILRDICTAGRWSVFGMFCMPYGYHRW